jgi:hypothetical protein
MKSAKRLELNLDCDEMRRTAAVYLDGHLEALVSMTRHTERSHVIAQKSGSVAHLQSSLTLRCHKTRNILGGGMGGVDTYTAWAGRQT